MAGVRGAGGVRAKSRADHRRWGRKMQARMHFCVCVIHYFADIILYFKKQMTSSWTKTDLERENF